MIAAAGAGAVHAWGRLRASSPFARRAEARPCAADALDGCWQCSSQVQGADGATRDATLKLVFFVLTMDTLGNTT